MSSAENVIGVLRVKYSAASYIISLTKQVSFFLTNFTSIKQLYAFVCLGYNPTD